MKPIEHHMYPADLLAAPRPSADRRWFVIRTRPRQEKALAIELSLACIPFCLPLVVRRLTYKGRSALNTAPLVSGRIFLFGTNQDRRRCLNNCRVEGIDEAPDCEEVHTELRRIARAIDTGIEITTDRLEAICQRVSAQQGNSLATSAK